MALFHEMSVRCSTDRVAEVEAELSRVNAIAVSLRNGDENERNIDGEWTLTMVIALLPEQADLHKTEVALSKLGCDSFHVETLDESQWREHLTRPTPKLTIGPFLIGGSLSNVKTPQIPLHIPAGLAFGTGEHETTALCLEWLTRQSPSEKHVLDLGCGSGILAIAAMKLGAASATAVDNDPDALAVTSTNASKNEVDLTVLHRLDLESTYDLIVANIYADTLIEYAENVQCVLNPGGTLALSGILESQSEQVKRSYSDIRFDSIEVRNNWVLLSGYKQ